MAEVEVQVASVRITEPYQQSSCMAAASTPSLNHPAPSSPPNRPVSPSSADEEESK